MFGKCEICFRAGYCKISECKEQELKELEIINRVVNSASITAKVDENLLKNLPEIKNVSPKDIKSTKKRNLKLYKIIKIQLSRSLKDYKTEYLVPTVQSLIKNYFTEPFQNVQGGVQEILQIKDHVGSAAEVTYWNQKAGDEVNQGTQIVQKLIQKLDNQINKINEAKKVANNDELNELKKAANLTKTEIKKIENDYNKAEKKLASKEEVIKGVLNSMVQNNVNAAGLGDSLEKVQQARKIVKSIKQNVKQEMKKLPKF